MNRYQGKSRSCSLRLAGVMVWLLGGIGCSGGSNEPFTETPGSAPPGAPMTAEEYDKLHPIDPTAE